jgi:predicted methyltransferase
VPLELENIQCTVENIGSFRASRRSSAEVVAAKLIFDALKKGGVYAIVDHSAAAGLPLRVAALYALRRWVCRFA